MIAGLIGPGSVIKTRQEFEALRFMKAEDLTAAQVDAIRAIREAIPGPVVGTPMQKVIKGSDIDAFINSNSNITGFVAKADDAGTGVFGSSDEMIEGLRLDYQGGFQGQSSVGIIEWPHDTSDAIEIPFGSGFGGTAPAVYPATGNALVANRVGRPIPEYRVPNGAELVPREGSQLFEVIPSGSKSLKAVFTQGAWARIP